MKVINRFWFSFAIIYSHLYGFLKDKFKIHIRGLGFILRKVKSDHQLLVNGRHLYFAHKMAEAYVRPLSGNWNEPETHMLINNIMNTLKITFIEVGANIGEILIDIAANPFCEKAIVFEPNPDAIAIINKNIALNTLNNCTVINKALGHEQIMQRMFFGSHSPTASLLLRESADGAGIDVEVSTLSQEIGISNFKGSNIILLIDVEGYELNVIQGGTDFIKNYKPLIIFEYHQETKKIFSLNALKQELGEVYKIYRVRQDSMLDSDVENAWNCVAIPRNTQFELILKSRIIV